MTLILSLSKSGQPPPPDGETRSLERHGLTIGRDSANDWILPACWNTVDRA